MPQRPSGSEDDATPGEQTVAIDPADRAFAAWNAEGAGSPLQYSNRLLPYPAVVPDLNRDGHAARTRQNGRGVDLNRNFPSEWRPRGRPWDPQYSGARPLSEPESRFAARLIRTIKPRITVWFHQPEPHTGDVVKISSLSDSWYASTYVGARSVL